MRILWVFVHRGDDPATGDAYYFHGQGLALADGHWFVDPLALDLGGVPVDAAHHPPLYPLFLGELSAIGLDSPLSQRIASALLGATAVLVVGLVARRLAGDRVGVLATVLAAVYPNLWINDAMLLSESMYLLAIAGVLWAAFTYREDPDLRRAAGLGVLLGLAALIRAEALMAFAFVAVPLVVVDRRGGWRRWLEGWRTKFRHLLVLGVAGAVVMGP
ncbi:MAG TPA: glycosyltransferase family 39 protein, partial [Acidimicrobiales bacterium]|nr:glycosyltransferase family 39 protein [Acidimicrobiales bacterium]